MKSQIQSINSGIYIYMLDFLFCVERWLKIKNGYIYISLLWYYQALSWCFSEDKYLKYLVWKTIKYFNVKKQAMYYI